jgi:SAM-dependent methyltransferase
MLEFAGKIMKRVKAEGAASTLRLIGARTQSAVRSRVEDRRRGLSTAGDADNVELGIADLRNHWYVPTDYETFQRAMPQVEVKSSDVFVDFGSGKGRIVILAAALPFRRVIGVEFSAQLHEIAAANVIASGCENIELVLADATQWQVPPDATVLFFYNPFDGVILAKVMANVKRSLAEAPRKITIVYVRPEKFFEKEVDWQSWLTRKAEIPCVEGKVSIYESIGGKEEA